jgi:NAD(P)-dependent dehydrogenase (short-subunit alcohol dehydrogenase family)
MKSVLVTGSARRIGRKLALDLAADGWDVAVHCNASIDDAEDVAGQIRSMGRRAVIVRGDLSHPEVPDRLITESAAALGGLTCLINNASLFEPDEVGTITQDISTPICVRLCFSPRPSRGSCRKTMKATSSRSSTSASGN